MKLSVHIAYNSEIPDMSQKFLSHAPEDWNKDSYLSITCKSRKSELAQIN